MTMLTEMVPTSWWTGLKSLTFLLRLPVEEGIQITEGAYVNIPSMFTKDLSNFCKPNTVTTGARKFRQRVAIMGLLHDVCKVNTYIEDFKNVKVDGKWEQRPYFRYEDSLPYGHGEKSVYILSAFIKLTREEALAINWHMGEYDIRAKNGSFMMADVYYKYPICFLLHVADLTATYLDEKCEN